MCPYYWFVVLNASFWGIFHMLLRSTLFFTETTLFVTKGQPVFALNFVLNKKYNKSIKLKKINDENNNR